MTIKNKIKPNEELYGDFELIPLPLEPIQQRIDFFKQKVKETWRASSEDFNVYYEAMNFWEGIKKEHCERD